MDFGVIFAWSILLGIFAAFGFGIWYVVKDAQNKKRRQLELKNLFQERKRQGTLPTKYLPVSKFKESMTDSILEECQVLYLAILDETEQGKLKFSTSELGRWMNSYVFVASAVINFKKHPIISCLVILLFLPISWFLILLWAGVLWLHSFQAGKMETAFSKYLNGSAKVGMATAVQSQPSSLATEIQKLEDMRTKGVISAEEFSQLKKKLIGAA